MFYLFGFPNIWLWGYQMKVMRTRYLRFYYYYRVDTSAGGLLVSEGIILPLMTWFIRYIIHRFCLLNCVTVPTVCYLQFFLFYYYWYLQILNNVIIITTNVNLRHVILADFDYSVYSFWSSCPHIHLNYLTFKWNQIDLCDC